MRILLITILTLLTTQWIIQNWLSDLNQTVYLTADPNIVFGVLAFPNLETLAIQQTEPGITIDEARQRQHKLFYERANKKYAEWQIRRSNLQECLSH